MFFFLQLILQYIYVLKPNRCFDPNPSKQLAEWWTIKIVNIWTTAHKS